MINLKGYLLILMEKQGIYTFTELFRKINETYGTAYSEDDISVSSISIDKLGIIEDYFGVCDHLLIRMAHGEEGVKRYEQKGHR